MTNIVIRKRSKHYRAKQMVNCAECAVEKRKQEERLCLVNHQEKTEQDSREMCRDG